MSLPPLNFTPREAAAVAVALSRSEHVLFTRDARSALQKIVAAMPERALEEARTTAEKVRLLVQPVPDPDAEIAETIWRALRDNHVLRIRYIDVGGNNFWGVQVFQHDGQEYVAASDRDFGLYIFRYTGN